MQPVKVLLLHATIVRYIQCSAGVHCCTICSRSWVLVDRGCHARDPSWSSAVSVPSCLIPSRDNESFTRQLALDHALIKLECASCMQRGFRMDIQIRAYR